MIPARVAVGLGARPGTPAVDLAAAVGAALADAGVVAVDVQVLATIDRRAAEPGVRAVAAGHGWALVAFPAADLAARAVPHGSEQVAAAVGTPSVAEAAALAAAGPHAVLILPKRVFRGSTVAIARA